MIYQGLIYRKARYTRYPEFGISIPGGYSIHGIDVSKYQHTIAWDEVKTMKVKNIQHGFAFIKATEGSGYTDPQFKRNWRKAKEAGLIRGAYHFFIHQGMEKHKQTILSIKQNWKVEIFPLY